MVPSSTSPLLDTTLPFPYPLPAATHGLQTADLNTDDLVTSDDELDSADRAAQYRRIQELAQAYRRGIPIFILSASLRGPFDKDWVNPWRKNRKRKADSEREDALNKEPQTVLNPVTQESDPKRGQYQCRHTVSLTPVAPHELPAPFTSPRRQALPGREDVDPRLLPSRKEDLPKTEEPQAEGSLRAHCRDSDWWLKRSHSCRHSMRIDRSISPTSRCAARSRSKLSKQSLETPKCTFQRPFLIDQRHVASPPPNNSDSTKRVLHPKKNRLPRTAKDVHDDCRSLLKVSSKAKDFKTSSCVVSSTSNLSDFGLPVEKKILPKLTQPMASPVSPGNGVGHGRPAQLKNMNTEVALGNSTKGTAATYRQDESKDGNVSLTVGSTAGNSVHNLWAVGSKAAYFTVGETGNSFPSAQQLENVEHIADGELSLHPTPASNGSISHKDSSPCTQLSTQTALLLAQVSFQNGLDSPDNIRAVEAGEKQSLSPYSPCGSQSQCSVTPFYRLNQSGLDSNGQDMASTRNMVDTTTPFIFTTRKSQSKPGTSIIPVPRSKVRKRAAFSASPSPIGPFDEDSRAHSGCYRIRSQASPRGPQYQLGDCNSESPLSGLPSTLSVPSFSAAKDEHGASPASSFNLSQAIAEAGRWLRRGFDLNLEMRESIETGYSSSAGAQHSTMSLDSTC